MKDHTEQQLDKLAKKVMKSSLLENPSLDFTANIMAKVDAFAKSKTIVYQPLISKTAWIIIIILVVGILSLGFFENGFESLGWFDTIYHSIITDNKISKTISSIAISKTMMYAIVFFGVVFFIQIPILKNRFEKRLAL